LLYLQLSKEYKRCTASTVSQTYLSLHQMKINNRRVVNVLTAGATATTIIFMAISNAMAEGDDGFQTPSGNIHCLIYGEVLQCEMSENTAKLPTKPKDCDSDLHKPR
jgi:hypothetical protein